jgi:hypothetical protein
MRKSRRCFENCGRHRIVRSWLSSVCFIRVRILFRFIYLFVYLSFIYLFIYLTIYFSLLIDILIDLLIYWLIYFRFFFQLCRFEKALLYSSQCQSKYQSGCWMVLWEWIGSYFCFFQLCVFL